MENEDPLLLPEEESSADEGEREHDVEEILVADSGDEDPRDDELPESSEDEEEAQRLMPNDSDDEGEEFHDAVNDADNPDQEGEPNPRERRQFFRRLLMNVRTLDDSDIPSLSVDSIRSMNFDKSLPATHRYLGDDLELLSGRTVHEELNIVSLPSIVDSNVILLPRQSIPMYFNRQRDKALLHRVLSGDKTFIFVPIHRDDSPNSLQIFPVARRRRSKPANGKRYGTVAEVIMSGEDDLENFKIIAEGRQRCEVLDTSSTIDGVTICRARILPDNNLPYDVFRALDPHPMLHRCFERRKQLQAITKIPPWVHSEYNVYTLMNDIRNVLGQLFANESGMATLSDDPSDFSFLVASFLPFSDSLKYKLVTCGCALQRLKLELEFLRRCEFLYCARCNQKLASVSEVIVMSSTGALSCYVNPGGTIYETLTINKVCGPVSLVGRPETANSWFPGYAWTCASCSTCLAHLGWLFTRVKSDLRPARFWGLSRSALSDGGGERELPLYDLPS